MNRRPPHGTSSAHHSRVNPWTLLVAVALGTFTRIVGITTLTVAQPTGAERETE